MDKETQNIIIHNGIMFGITIFFIIYFNIVENSLELQKQINENITAVPIGQFLAYEGYFGYVLLKQVRRIQEKKKVKQTLSNVITLGGRLFHEYATQMIDFIGITIITHSFFIHGYPNFFPDSFEIMTISNLYFLIFVPGMGIILHKLFSKRKLEYVQQV